MVDEQEHVIGSIQFCCFYYNEKLIVLNNNCNCVCYYNICNTKTELILPLLNLRVVNKTFYTALQSMENNMSIMWCKYVSNNCNEIYDDEYYIIRKRLIDTFHVLGE